MKLHHILIVTNLVTLAALAYVGLRPAAEPASTQPKLVVAEMPQFERRHMSMPVSGYRDIVGYDNTYEKPWPKRGDTLKIRKGEPFIFIAWEAWLPIPTAPDAYDLQPEFLFTNPGSSWEEQDTLDDTNFWTDRTGKMCIYNIRTDTVDMQGKSQKRLIFTPIMRYVVGDSIEEFKDTVEVWVVDK